MRRQDKDYILAFAGKNYEAKFLGIRSLNTAAEKKIKEQRKQIERRKNRRK